MGNSWAVPDGGVTGVAGNFAATAVSTKESMEAAAKQSVPLKVMVFVDGTWLYYSFFGRYVRAQGKEGGLRRAPGWRAVVTGPATAPREFCRSGCNESGELHIVADPHHAFDYFYITSGAAAVK